MSIPLVKDYEAHVQEIAPIHNLDPLLVSAIIQVESSGNKWSTRYEPLWHYFKDIDAWSRKIIPHTTVNTEMIHQQTSWGLMQVMGSVARELGFDGHLPELTQARINILLGCKQLVRVNRPGYIVDDQIAAYNAGSARRSANGLLENQSYVDKVKAIWTMLKQAKHLA